MPQKTATHGGILSIHVDRQGPFFAGDTITGHVSLRSAEAEVAISIRLQGRAKAKSNDESEGVREGTADGMYRSEISLLGPNTGHSILRPESCYESNADGQSYPFQLQIPTHPDPTSAYWHPAKIAPFLPFKEAAQHTLPPTYHAESGAGFVSTEVYVEYYLEATTRGTVRTQAIRPVQIQGPRASQQLANFALAETWKQPQIEVKSQRLMPGMEEARLTLGQKTKKLFGTSTVPRYSFQLHVYAPTRLQIENPRPVSFSLRASPDWDKTSHVLREVPRKIVVDRFLLRLETRNSCIIPELSTAYLTFTQASRTLGRFSRPKPKRQRNSEVAVEPDTEGELPDYDPNQDPSDDAAPDIDSLFVPVNWDLPALNMGKACGAVVKDGIAPSFTTYNIKVSHVLHWEIVLDIAGELKTHKGQQEVQVFPKC